MIDFKIALLIDGKPAQITGKKLDGIFVPATLSGQPWTDAYADELIVFAFIDGGSDSEKLVLVYGDDGQEEWTWKQYVSDGEILREHRVVKTGEFFAESD